MKKHPLGRELDPQWEKGRRLLFHGLFVPTLWQRVQILFGFNVLMSSKVYTQHIPGRCATGVFPRITSAIDMKDPQVQIILKLQAEGAKIDALPSADQFEAHEKMLEELAKIPGAKSDDKKT